METTNQNGLVLSQVVTQDGSLTLGTLPLDLGMSQVAGLEKDTIILADGSQVKLTGTEQAIKLVVADRDMRLKQTLVHLYLSGLNMEIARNYFREAYGDDKKFWEKMTEKTGYSKAKLKNEIKISQGFTQEQIESLTKVGTPQSVAIRLLTASPAAKSEAVEEARQGKRVTNAVVDELTGKDEEESDAQDDNIDDELITVMQPSIPFENNGNSSNSQPVNAEPTEQTIDVQGSFVNYKDLVQDVKDYAPSTKSTEERLQGLVASIYRIRKKHELATIRGESLNCGAAILLAEFYGIVLPEESEKEDEPSWVKDARNKLSNKKLGRKFIPLYIMAFVDGHLAFLNGETDAPDIYETLYPAKFKEKEKVEAMYDLWAVGYGLAKAASK